MNFRNIARSGLVLLALSLPVSFTGCSQPAPESQTPEQSQTLRNLESRAKLAERSYASANSQLAKLKKELAETEEECDQVKRERGKLEREKDRLLQRYNEYPRDTPADVIKENKELREQLLRNNTIAEVVSNRHLPGLMSTITDLRIRNNRLVKENEQRRLYMNLKGEIYLNEIDFEKLDPTKTPLAIEQARHEETKAQYKVLEAKVGRIQAEADSEGIRHKTERERLRGEVLKLTTERDQAIVERDTYYKGYQAWMNKAKQLGGYSQNSNR